MKKKIQTILLKYKRYLKNQKIWKIIRKMKKIVPMRKQKKEHRNFHM